MSKTCKAFSGAPGLIAILAAGCGSAGTAAEFEAKARAATAAAVETMDPASIVVADLRQFPTRATWRATMGDKVFVCSSDERFGLPECQPAE